MGTPYTTNIAIDFEFLLAKYTLIILSTIDEMAGINVPTAIVQGPAGQSRRAEISFGQNPELRQPGMRRPRSTVGYKAAAEIEGRD